QQVTCEESGKNLSNIPTNLFQNITKLSLKNNEITLKDSDKEILQSFINLTELYLNENMISVLYNNSFCNLTKLTTLDISNNHISTVHKAAFAGLNQLSVLNLSYNRITQLDSDVFTSLRSLTVLNLQYNFLKYFHIKSPFKLTKIFLTGNPWTCSCDLLDLQMWLTASSVIMENENSTTCILPNTEEKVPIKTAAIPSAECKTEASSSEDDIVTSTSVVKLKSSALVTALTTSNTTGNNGTRAELPLVGKSWTFLAGVLGFVLGTTLLILTAIKCPTWCSYLISYSHHRLEENDSEMFEQEFSADTSSSPTVSNDEDLTVIFEKNHAFVPEEDGFIEDKYIDLTLTEES
ncbi:LRC19 protein, partial [Trogon melanurus]|nr:LRC19 protein [Trogon melanurus]